MKRTVFFFFLFLEITISIQVYASVHPNSLYNPSFVEMNLRKDSLGDWLKYTFIDVRSDIMKLNNRMFLGTTYDNQLCEARHFSLNRNFLIPESSKIAQLRLRGMFDYPENMISPIMLSVRQYVEGVNVETDSVILQKTDTLNTWKMEFALSELCTDISIHIQSRMVASYVLDSLNIRIDGVPIECIAITNTEKTSKIAINDLKNNEFNELHFPVSPMIIGIGESVHGSKTLNSLRNQLIFEAIDKDQLDVLLMEVPANFADKYNRYVNSVVDTFEMNITYNLLANQELVDLLDGIRQINANRKKTPIQIAGFDIPYNQEYFNAFNYCLNQYRYYLKTSTNPDIVQIVERLFDAYSIKDSTIEKTKPSLPDHDFWGSYLVRQMEHFEWGLQGLTNSFIRDSMMFDNIKTIVQYFGLDKKYIATAHLGHLIKTDLTPTALYITPLGFYMNQAYGPNYKLLGLFVGSGEVRCEIYKKDSVIRISENLKISDPIDGSIEKVCSEIDKDTIYLSKNVFNNYGIRAFRSRCIGSRLVEYEFKPIDIDDLDALLFVRHSEPLNNVNIKINK